MTYTVVNRNATHGGLVCETPDLDKAIRLAIQDSMDVADPCHVISGSRVIGEARAGVYMTPQQAFDEWCRGQ